ncbi:prolactin-releasing peptide receptor-like [Acanthaster planci]|uniref:Prolactin-releasing peptide receptor-like n=1 Tax=Acanthaster planci TaxID=133434 RepID=A0A8B7YFX8_ACAPL|nr:prolactin-releasing peptide receptor-like [Acanthaster planci]XP_022089608.1 prolactin-releasing peptide receptor-like [Acanthaster planci]XP_022090449.1 prolactin-releasing peptide receptor-like [Acanthaster planci]XP_022091300.1 prolactin-releasing peptide receptor-like [Acanthaster planci]
MAAEENLLPALLGLAFDQIARTNSTQALYLPLGNDTGLLPANGTGFPPSSEPSREPEEDFCDLQYGVQDQTAQSLITAVYSLTILLAVVGNVIVIAVLGFAARAKTDLNHFLVNLAVADLLSAVFCMPFTFVYIMKEDWYFGSLGCPLIFFIQQVVICVSVFTLTAVSIDRYFAVVRPLKARIARSNAKTVLVISGIWVASCMMGLVQLLLARTQEYHWCYGERHLAVCTEHWPDENLEFGYEIFNMGATYFAPLIIFCFTYSVVGRKLWGRNLPGNADHMRDACHRKAKRKVIKMLMMIVFLFIGSWLPLYIYHLIVITNNAVVSDYPNFFFVYFFTGHWLAMANSFMNPIVFGFLNDSFRADVRRLLQRCGPCTEKLNQRRRLRSRMSTTSSLTTRTSSLFNHQRSGKNGGPPMPTSLGPPDQQALERIGNGQKWNERTYTPNGRGQLLVED